MKKFTLFLFCLAVFCQKMTAQLPQNFSKNGDEKISPILRASFLRGETADLVVILKEQADVRAAKNFKTKNEKAAFVFEKLKTTAQRTQADLNQILHQKGVFANSLYLVNAIAIEKCDAELARFLADRPEVAYLSPDPEVHFSGFEKVENVAPPKNRGAVEWGVERVNAPAMWSLGHTGQGITVGGADTGYDWTHPALINKYRGTKTNGTFDHNYNWHDAIHEASELSGNPNNPCGFNISAPCDDNSHGTHTMGTMVGDDGAGNQIGVAPGAKWVACRNMERGNGKPSSYIECFEWFLAPTDTAGKNPDPARAPQVVNNSWYCSFEEGCTDLGVNEMIHKAVINLKAAGTVVVVSNGNFGSNCSTGDNPPAYFEESFSVGATQESGAIANFSSRGPVLIDGSNRVKPNVAAPGQNVRSSTPNGNFSSFSGTSMAGPHVVGTVALLLSARPDLIGNVDLIEDIFENSGVFKTDTLDCPGSVGGSDQPNNTFGFGEVDALAALNYANLLLPQTEPATEISVSVFPNPTSDVVFFNFKNLKNDDLLEIFNAAGQPVFSKKINQPTLRISIGNLPAGVYFWKMGGENGQVVFN